MKPIGLKTRAGLVRSETVKTTQVQGVHHITVVGSTRRSAVDFWQGVLGMPFLFEQPNIGNPDENHLYFDPGDGRLLTMFTDETRQDAGRHAPREIGCVEHLAFNVSRATFALAPARLRERSIEFIERDRGFMDSIYLRDPNGLKVELACYKFETPRDSALRMCSRKPIHSASSAANITSRRNTWPTPSSCCWPPVGVCPCHH